MRLETTATERRERPTPLSPSTRPFLLSRAGEIGAIAALSVAAVIGWGLVLSELDEYAIDDTGIIAILPPSAYVLLALLSLAFALTLRMRPLPQLLAAAQVVGLVFMLVGAPAMFEELPRFVTAWLHAGFADAIARTGDLYPIRDARFDWPGFFVLFAFIQNVTGSDSFVPLLGWIPVVQVVAYVPALYLIYRSATGDLRLVWLAIWFFVLTNWVGQDYFSPQGLNFLFMITIFAILLTWFRSSPSSRMWLGRMLAKIPFLVPSHRQPLVVDPNAEADGGPQPFLTDRQQVGMIAVISALFGFSVASHQLTPFAIIGGTMLLMLFGRIRHRGLLIVMILISSVWLVYLATTFLDGRLSTLLGDVGRADQIAESNVADRLVGSIGHVFVVQMRLLFTLAVWGLALFGGIRRLRAGRLDLSLALLAIAPFGLVLLQGYGGEMILRIFFFSLPFMAFFGAALIFPDLHAGSRWTSGLIVVLSVALAVGLIITRYGNEKADLVTRNDLAALEYVKEAAPAGTVIGAVNFRVPLEYRDWERHRYRDVAPAFVAQDIRELYDDLDMDALFDILLRGVDEDEVAHLVVTRGQRAHAELYWGLTDDHWVESMAFLDRELEVVYRNEDATVYRVTPREVEEGEE